MFQMLEFDVKDVVIVTGTRSKPAHEQEELHTALRHAGLSLALE